MLIEIKELSDRDAISLMAVYKESNKKNISYFFPEIQDEKQGLNMIEEEYTKWLRDDFLKSKNTFCYVWIENDLWVSSLRLHCIDSKIYFIEALETHPEYRKKGYAEKLINGIIDRLKENGDFEIHSYTSITNIASQKTHKRCGFLILDEKPFDYINREYVENSVGFLYKYSINKQEILLNKMNK